MQQRDNDWIFERAIPREQLLRAPMNREVHAIIGAQMKGCPETKSTANCRREIAVPPAVVTPFDHAIAGHR
jgi:hypothetical protein